MNPLRLVFAEARKGMWSLLALALLLGLSIGSGVCITSVEKAVRAGAARAGDDFDLIIGAQGSATDLVLSGVYLRENTLIYDQESYPLLRNVVIWHTLICPEQHPYSIQEFAP